MVRRVALAVVWFLAAWSAASMIAFAVGLSSWIVAVVAVGAAAVAYSTPALRPVRRDRSPQPQAVRTSAVLES